MSPETPRNTSPGIHQYPGSFAPRISTTPGSTGAPRNYPWFLEIAISGRRYCLPALKATTTPRPWSVSYESSPALDGQGSHSEANLDIPLCQRCTCEKCKKLQQRARRKRGKHASLETVASLFPRTDLVNILDKYWEMLQVHGLFADQSREPFQWSNAARSMFSVASII